MLGLIRRAKYANVAVAPEPATDGPAVRTQLLADQLVGYVRAKYVRLVKHIDKKLEPTRFPLPVTPRVINSLDTTWYPTNELRAAIREGNAIEFVSRRDTHELGFHVVGCGACCIDAPDREITARKAIFTQRHMPYGLALVAAIIGEATCSPLDPVYDAYLEWEWFFYRTFQAGLLRYNPDTNPIRIADFETAETVVFAYTGQMIRRILIPVLTRYRALDNHRVMKLSYRHWLLQRDVKRTIRRFLRVMERAMRAEVNMFAIEPRGCCT